MMVEAEAFVPMMLPATNTLGLARTNGLGVRKDDRSETGQEFRDLVVPFDDRMPAAAASSFSCFPRS